MSEHSQIVVYTDGAARGNPGLAGAGASLETPDGEILDEATRFLGRATNNQAEYEALILGLERARELGVQRVEIRADSQLLVRQMLGEYRIRDEELRLLAGRADRLSAAFDEVAYVHVRRELNKRADRLANRAIDQAGGSGRS